MTFRNIFLYSSLFALTASPVLAQKAASSSLRSQGDTRVNTMISSAQERPSVAVFEGGWVSAWQSREGTADLESRARRSQASQQDILVNTSSLGTQRDPDVAADPQGNFAVVWYSNEPAEPGGDDSGFGIAARLFDADGNALGPAFQVNDLTDGHQMHPRVAMAQDGSFVVTYRSSESFGGDDSGSSVQARLFDAGGIPLGPSFQVNTTTFLDQQYPDVALSPAGAFIVTWQSLLQDGSVDGVYARRFDANGTPLSGELQVNVTTEGSQSRPEIVIANNGRAMIVWQCEDLEAGLEVRGRIFAASGQAIGGEIPLNTLTGGTQNLPSVSALSTGFITAWQSSITEGTDQSGFSVQVRVFGFGGQTFAPELQLNTSTQGGQTNVSAAGYSTEIAVVWDSDHQSFTDEDIYIFRDETAQQKPRR
ncbi:MAG: hypothetical protein AAF725_00550 [Acidobacteriota bacterium]